MALRFVALGHVTNDRVAGGVVPGGSVLYAGIAAAELGAEVRVVTSHGPDFVGVELLAELGVTVEAKAAAATTCFENVYVGGKRRQRVLAVAERLASPVSGPADVVYAGPVVDEVAATALVAPPGAVLGAGLQGWLRTIDADGTVRPRALPDPAIFAPCHVLFASDEDLGADAARLIPALCAQAQIVCVTEGARGARVFVDGKPFRVPAHPANEVDPTGAGDVFAAAFLLAIAARQSPTEAAALAACAASIAVEGTGPSALAGLARVGERLAWVRSNIRSGTGD